MNVHDIYTKYLRADLLPPEGIVVTIVGWSVRELRRPDGVTVERVVLDLATTDGEKIAQAWVLNQTCAYQLADALGPETNDWIGAMVALKPVPIRVAGEKRLAIRPVKITPPSNPSKQTAPACRYCGRTPQDAHGIPADAWARLRVCVECAAQRGPNGLMVRVHERAQALGLGVEQIPPMASMLDAIVWLAQNPEGQQ